MKLLSNILLATCGLIYGAAYFLPAPAERVEIELPTEEPVIEEPMIVEEPIEEPTVKESLIVRWHTDYREAHALAKEQDKLLFLYFTFAGCAPCREMERNVFADDSVIQQLNKRAVCLKVDRDADSENITRLYRVDVHPTFIFQRDESMWRTRGKASTPRRFLDRMEVAKK